LLSNFVVSPSLKEEKLCRKFQHKLITKEISKGISEHPFQGLGLRQEVGEERLKLGEEGA
jgi:hypothetical protein